ncbi:hypothetical protein SKAU_G00257610 [Synaphobranchus kaupii]|uniref:Uncharacterized protein n=1 Tax=Synaphobranchus kaupii TaxID=118154 RepID=A0A9Q1IRL0_SYNKA|nr:hypothetical protein SKAU_G00257610 [Synaphobranchus kaupii]
MWRGGGGGVITEIIWCLGGTGPARDRRAPDRPVPQRSGAHGESLFQEPPADRAGSPLLTARLLRPKLFIRSDELRASEREMRHRAAGGIDSHSAAPGWRETLASRPSAALSGVAESRRAEGSGPLVFEARRLEGAGAILRPPLWRSAGRFWREADVAPSPPPPRRSESKSDGSKTTQYFRGARERAAPTRSVPERDWVWVGGERTPDSHRCGVLDKWLSRTGSQTVALVKAVKDQKIQEPALRALPPVTKGRAGSVWLLGAPLHRGTWSAARLGAGKHFNPRPPPVQSVPRSARTALSTTPGQRRVCHRRLTGAKCAVAAGDAGPRPSRLRPNRSSSGRFVRRGGTPRCRLDFRAFGRLPASR